MKSEIMWYGHSPELKALVNQKNQELLPCPFCGDEAKLDNQLADIYRVNCGGCDAQVSAGNRSKDALSVDAHKASIELAVENWNRRYRL